MADVSYGVLGYGEVNLPPLTSDVPLVSLFSSHRAEKKKCLKGLFFNHFQFVF